MDENINTSVNMGIVKISDDVVSVIAGLVIKRSKGYNWHEYWFSWRNNSNSRRKKNPSKGVKVTVGEDSASIDIVVGVEYGVKIPEIAKVVQDNVKKAVETMTGLKVSAVNIYVQNVIVPKNENDKDLIEE